MLNALIDHPLGLMRIIPLRKHGQVETLLLPGILAIPYLAGALRDRRARAFSLFDFATAAANDLLADEPDAPEPPWQQLVDGATPDPA